MQIVEIEPRPPTTKEIAQAIVDHATEQQGRDPNDVSAGFTEIHVSKNGPSQIIYEGPIGQGTFNLEWPTTPISEDDSTSVIFE